MDLNILSRIGLKDSKKVENLSSIKSLSLECYTEIKKYGSEGVDHKELAEILKRHDNVIYRGVNPLIADNLITIGVGRKYYVVEGRVSVIKLMFYLYVIYYIFSLMPFPISVERVLFGLIMVFIAILLRSENNIGV